MVDLGVNRGLSMEFDKLVNAFIYSLSGIGFLLKERAFVQELVLGVGIVVLLCFSRNTTIEILYIVSSYFLVLITESLNTCVETVVDKISLKQNPISKKAKDVGSAAVFISLLHLGLVIILLIKF